MGVIWHKVWFDLWHNKLRTALVVVSIAVGVFAVGMTFGMVDQMLPTMDNAHRSTDPSHGTIYLTQPVDEDTVMALEKIPGLASLEPATLVMIRYKKHPEDEWSPGSLLQRADFENQSHDVVQLRQGEWPHDRLLGIERMHSPFYGIAIGDEVIIEVGDRPRVFQIGSVIRHPFVPPPSMYDLTWFFADAETMEMFGIPKNHYTEIRFRVTPYSDTNARKVAAEIKERLSKQGIRDNGVVYQDPDVHWGRFFIEGISLVLQVLAVLSLLLSVVLVLNTVTALITQQTNQIGIIKAIGGSSFTITRVYLVGVLFYGVLALLVALPLGAAAAYAITRWFLGLYNIEYSQFLFSPRLLWIEVFASLVVPLIAALIPVLNGAAISVRQAIASYGIGGDFGSSWIDRRVEAIGRRFLISYQAIALANTFRRKGRLALTQFVLVIAGIMFMMVMGLSSSINATIEAEFVRYSYDVNLTFEQLQRVDFSREIARQVPGVEDADMWLIVPASIFRDGRKRLDAGLGATLQGMPLDEPMYRPLIVQGRWLQPGDERVIVMSQDTFEDEHYQLGDKVVLDLGEWGKHEWTIIGTYRTFQLIGRGGFSMDTIYAPRPEVYAVTKKTGRGTNLLVRTHGHSAAEVEQVTSQVEDRFRQNHITIANTETLVQLKQLNDSSFGIVIAMLLVLAVIVAIVGGIGLMGSLWISVIERTKEIGIMRAVGARSWHIVSMFVLEGSLQGLLSWLIAVPLALFVTPTMSNMLGMTMFEAQLDYRFNYPAMLIWLGVVLAISVAASLIPAYNAAGINVRQSLSYE